LSTVKLGICKKPFKEPHHMTDNEQTAGGPLGRIAGKLKEAAGSAVGNDELATDSVDTAELIADSISTIKIKDGAITNAKLGADSVTGAKVQNGSLTAPDVAGSAPGGPLSGQLTIDPGSIAGGACSVQTISLSGVQAGDHVILNGVSAATGGYSVEALTGTTNNLRVQFCNTDAMTPVDPPSADYAYLAIHP